MKFKMENLEDKKNETSNLAETSISKKPPHPTETINLIQKGILALIPLVILVPNLGFITKSLFFYLFALSSIAYFAWHTFKTKTINFTLSPISFALFVFSASALISSTLTTDYPLKQLLGLGGIYALTYLVPLLSNNLTQDKKTFSRFIFTLTLTTLALTFTSMLQLFGTGPSLIINKILKTELANDLSFSLTGSSFITTQVIAFTMFALLVFKKQSSLNKLNKRMITTALMLLALPLSVHLWSLLPNQDTTPKLLNLSDGWSVAIESIKTPTSALIGSGPESFSQIYRLYRSPQMNNDLDEQAVLTNNANTPLTLVSTQGLLGLAAWIMLFYFLGTSLNNKIPKEQKSFGVLAMGLLLLQLWLPTNIVMLTLLMIVLAFYVSSSQDKMKLAFQSLDIHKSGSSIKIEEKSTGDAAPFLPYVLSAIILAGVAYQGYWLFRLHKAWYFVAKAQHIGQEDIQQYYNYQKKATFEMPYLDSIRRSFAITNLDLAINASKLDNEQAAIQVTKFTDTALKEARAASALDPKETQNWYLLTKIYARLIESTQGAAYQWLIDSYLKAMQTDPSNPYLRVELGTVLQAKGNYADAISFYNQAISLKPDLVSAHYNLGKAYEQNKQYDQALKSFQTALLQLEDEQTAEKQEIQDAITALKQKATQAPQTNDTDQGATIIDDALEGSDQVVEPNQEEISIGKEEAVNVDLSQEASEEANTQ